MLLQPVCVWKEAMSSEGEIAETNLEEVSWVIFSLFPSQVFAFTVSNLMLRGYNLSNPFP